MHKTKVGDDMTAQKAAELWQIMENQETVGELLDKIDYLPEMTCQVLRILEEYLLVSIKEKTVVDYVKQIHDQTQNDFAELSKLLPGIIGTDSNYVSASLTAGCRSRLPVTGHRT